MRTAFLTFLFLTTLTPQLSFATPSCEQRLESHIQGLAFVVMHGLRSGALTRAEIQKFLAAKEWKSPFLTSSDHVLKFQLQEAFAKLEAQLRDGEHVLVKAEIARQLAEKQALQEIANKASADTIRVLNPHEMDAFPQKLYSVERIFEQRRYQGRPVFLSVGQETATKTRFVLLYDPHNPVESKKVLKFPYDPEHDKDWIPKNIGLESPGPTEVISGKKKRVSFWDADGNRISSFSVGRNRDEYPKIAEVEVLAPPGGGSPMAAVTYRGGDSKFGVFLVDVKSGQAISRFDVPQKHLRLVYKRGIPFFVYSSGSDQPATLTWINALNGDTATMPVADSSGIYNLGLFRIGTVDYLAWAESSRLVLFDVDAESPVEIPFPPRVSYGSALEIYQYEGDQYIFLAWQFNARYKLTAPSRPTAIVGTGPAIQ